MEDKTITSQEGHAAGRDVNVTSTSVSGKGVVQIGHAQGPVTVTVNQVSDAPQSGSIEAQEKYQLRSQDEFFKETKIWCPVEAQPDLMRLRSLARDPADVKLAYHYRYITWREHAGKIVEKHHPFQWTAALAVVLCMFATFAGAIKLAIPGVVNLQLAMHVASLMAGFAALMLILDYIFLRPRYVGVLARTQLPKMRDRDLGMRS